MFKKGLVTLVCLTVMSALWAWAATTYSISTKITSLGTTAVTQPDGKIKYVPIVGGDIKVRGGEAQTTGIKYSNFTTSATLDVVVTPAPGYKISALTGTGDAVIKPLPTLGAGAVTVQVKKPAFDTIGTAAYVVATFAPAGETVTVTKNWQLQVQNNTLNGGNIKIERATNTPIIHTGIKPLLKSYIDTTPVKVTVTAADGYAIDYLIIDGVKTFAFKNTASKVIDIDPSTGSRLKSVVAGFLKKSLRVTTQTATYQAPVIVNPAFGKYTTASVTKFVPNGIEPVNPVADPTGSVRLVVTPTGANNKITSFGVTSGSYVKITYYDAYGKELTALPAIGPVKVTISGITTNITVAATYGFDASKSPAYANCTQTCHLDAGLGEVKTTLVAADTQWLNSKHRTGNVDCVACHYDAAAEAAMPGLDFTVAGVKDALCARCHSNANPDFPAALNVLHTAAQNACSTCHTFTGGHNPVKGAVAGSLAAKHTGGSYGGNAQYVTQGLTCAACHVADVAPEIMAAWAESKHGAVDGPAWMTSSSHDWPVYSGGSCKRCHTGIGFKDSVDGTTTTQTAGVAGQVLACSSCHTNVATGAVRANGAAYTLPYQIQGTDGAADVITLPGKSGVCLPCHAGRGSGAGVTAATAAAFNGRFPSHYFNAGASLFAASGYHYAGQVYNQGYHKNIAGEGACVTCHMADNAGKGHTFEAVTKTDGTITAINTVAACAACHADMTAAKLQADKASFIAARETLKAALETKGLYYNAADGGYYTDATFATKKTSFASVGEQGAAYNYWLLEHAEAGMYVHNRSYGLKLIADSLDFLADGTVTGNFTNAELTAAGTDHNLAAATAGSCNSCHFPTSAVPTSAVSTNHFGGSFGGNAQYVTQNLTCAACHAGDNADILTEWAASSHGAVDGPAWMTSSSHDWPVYSGGSCKRCHTGIGFVNNITGSTTAQATGVAGQVLDCASCHSDVANGVVRTLTGGTYTLPYQIQGSTPDADVISVPGASQVCLPCHAGRGSGAGVTAASAAAFNGRFPQHYFGAGATLFSANGYHFAGQTYPAGYHKNIGGDGACVTCHMNNASAGKGHTFEAVTKTDGVVTAINTAARCAACHTNIQASDLVTAKAGLIAALDKLKVELETKETAFYNVADGGFYTTADFATKKTVWSSADALGAANNYWLFEHAEPAAYVHNRGYAMKLIADSVDFLNDGVIDGDSGIVLAQSVITGHGSAMVAHATTGGNLNTGAESTYGLLTNIQNPTTSACAACHNDATAAELKLNPSADDIATRFASSRHAEQSARAAFCSACHSHEGYVQYAAIGKKETYGDLSAAYTADTTNGVYSLPVAGTTVGLPGVTRKNCATCHDPASTVGQKFRGAGDVTATVVPGNGSTAAVDTTRVTYSAEFNLCTACHQVKLQETFVATDGYGQRGMFKYELASTYSANNLLDAPGGTFKTDWLKDLPYHAESNTGRKYIDTHFKGNILGLLVTGNHADNGDIAVPGYNINPGSADACTICHDPHTAGKLLSAGADDNTNKVISYTTGLGGFHTNYEADPFSRINTGCTPCHTGKDYPRLSTGATLTDLNTVPAGVTNRWSVVGCNSCHNLAQANTAPGTNNAAAFDDVRQFPAGYEYKFNSAAAAIPVADLGNSAICFECHKGRTAGVLPATDPAAGTTNYAISYLHYAPSAAIIFGDESKMVLTYGGTYAGRFVHNQEGATLGVDCTGCHNVHTGENVMTSNAVCAGCHNDAVNKPELLPAALTARVTAFGEALLDAIFTQMEAAYGLKATDATAFNAFNGGSTALDATNLPGVTGLKSMLNYMFETLPTQYVGDPVGLRAAQEDKLMTYIELRQSYFPNRKVAQAVATWKIFNYEDGSEHGMAHGHGGSWAHNSKFARQVQFDAIQDLGVSTGDLVRP